jgi:Ca2+-dependent lipid-binding protein
LHFKLNFEKHNGQSGGTLSLVVIEARNLVGKDGNVLPDTFVHAQLGKLQKKTKIIKKNPNPNFQELIDFDIKHYESTHLALSVVEIIPVGTEKMLSALKMDISQVYPSEQNIPQVIGSLTLLKQFQLSEPISNVKKQRTLSRPFTNVQGTLGIRTLITYRLVQIALSAYLSNYRRNGSSHSRQKFGRKF